MSAFLRKLQLRRMAHRKQVPVWFWVCTIGGLLVPVILELILPSDAALPLELIWLTSLATAFLLPLHYGARGSVITLLAGTAVLVSARYLLGGGPNSAEWHALTPVYIAYGAVTISVGWFSETLDGYFRQLLANERMVAIGQLAVTINHRANNALAAIVAESSLLLIDGNELSSRQRSSVEAINESAKRIASDVRKIAKLRDSPIITYAGEVKMIDLEKAESWTSGFLPTI